MRELEPSDAGAARNAEFRIFAVLAALGVWTMAVPYLGRAIGLSVDVATRIEVVDHVLPGALVAGIGTTLALNVRRRVAPGWTRLVGAGVCFLAGFWVLATHVPLVSEATHSKASWGAAIWHASTAVPIVVLSLWIVLRES